MAMTTNISTFQAPFPTANSSIYNTLPAYCINAAFVINMILGFPANCYILWLSIKELTQGKSTKIFIFNATLAEIIFSFVLCFGIPRYFFDCTWCRLPLFFLSVLLLVGRPLFLSCICVERYLGVLHPLIYLKLKPMKYRIFISVAGWIVIIASCVIGTMNVNNMYIFLLPELLFFFSVKLYSCLMVLKALLRPGPGDNSKKKNRVNQDKIKAFRIILLVLVSASVTYGPILVSLVLYYILDSEKFLLCWFVSLAFGVLMGFVCPSLYLKWFGKLPFGKREKVNPDQIENK